jgi:hypothetical protein
MKESRRLTGTGCSRCVRMELPDRQTDKQIDRRSCMPFACVACCFCAPHMRNMQPARHLYVPPYSAGREDSPRVRAAVYQVPTEQAGSPGWTDATPLFLYLSLLACKGHLRLLGWLLSVCVLPFCHEAMVVSSAHGLSIFYDNPASVCPCEFEFDSLYWAGGDDSILPICLVLSV